MNNTTNTSTTAPTTPAHALTANMRNFFSSQESVAPQCKEWQRADELFFAQLPAMLDQLKVQVAAQVQGEFKSPAAYHVAATLNALDIQAYVF